MNNVSCNFEMKDVISDRKAIIREGNRNHYFVEFFKLCNT